MRPIIPFSLSRPLTVVSDIGESKSSLISARIYDADFCRLPLLIAHILSLILQFVFLGRPDRFLLVFCPVSRYLLMAVSTEHKDISNILAISSHFLPVVRQIMIWARFLTDISCRLTFFNVEKYNSEAISTKKREQLCINATTVKLTDLQLQCGSFGHFLRFSAIGCFLINFHGNFSEMH